MRDIDGDGKPEIVFGTGGVGGTLAFGWPDPRIRQHRGRR